MNKRKRLTAAVAGAAGMNRLGEASRVLFIVTCQIDTGTPGFHYFMRPKPAAAKTP